MELANWLGFRTVVTDDRPEEVDEAAVPLADVRIAGSIDDALAAVLTVAAAEVAEVEQRRVELVVDRAD